MQPENERGIEYHSDPEDNAKADLFGLVPQTLLRDNCPGPAKQQRQKVQRALGYSPFPFARRMLVFSIYDKGDSADEEKNKRTSPRRIAQEVRYGHA